MGDRGESNGTGFAIGLLVGLLVGAGVALVMAPEKGEVLRRRLGKKIRQAGESARDTLEEAATELKDEVGRRRRELARTLE